MDLEEKIREIEKEISSIKSNRKKDGWDVLQVFGGMLIPLAIAYAGWEYSASMKEAEIESASTIANLQLKFSEQKEISNQRISEVNARVGQAGLIASFLEPLLSDDPKRQKIAIEAVLIALPDDGLKLVKVVERSDKSDAIKAFASDSIINHRNKLLAGFFSVEASVRRDSYARLYGAYSDDSSIILDLIEKSRNNASNYDSAVNVLAFLSEMNGDLLKPYIGEIIEFTDDIKENGPKTRERIRKLVARLPCSGIKKNILNGNIAEINRWIAVEDKLKLTPLAISPFEAHMEIALVDDGSILENITMKKENKSVFMYQGFRYDLLLNGVTKQIITGDLRVNVSMTKQECN